MWADWENSPNRHFYVDEVARTKAGQYILPKRWIVVNEKECAEGHPVYFSERVSCIKLGLTFYDLNTAKRGKYRVRKTETVRIPASELALTYPEIKTLGHSQFQSKSGWSRAFGSNINHLKRLL
jgi:hypothetical protein